VHKLIYILRLEVAILDFPFSVTLLTSDYNQYNTTVMPVAESVGVAVGSLFQTSVELKINYMLYAVHKLYLLLPVLSRHIGGRYTRSVFVALSFWKSNQSVSFNSIL